MYRVWLRSPPAPWDSERCQLEFVGRLRGYGNPSMGASYSRCWVAGKSEKRTCGLMRLGASVARSFLRAQASRSYQIQLIALLICVHVCARSCIACVWLGVLSCSCARSHTLVESTSRFVGLCTLVGQRGGALVAILSEALGALVAILPQGLVSLAPRFERVGPVATRGGTPSFGLSRPFFGPAPLGCRRSGTPPLLRRR